LIQNALGEDSAAPGDESTVADSALAQSSATGHEGSAETLFEGQASSEANMTVAAFPRTQSDPALASTAAMATTHSGLTRGAMVGYFGDYEVERELGRGGMGVVYRARQVSLNRPVALKMIKSGVLADDAELRRFQNEAEAVALLDHPGIVAVYEVGEHDGQRYFSMQLVEGDNLAVRLASYKDDPEAVARLVAAAAEAVHHAHMRGILHRDLKPANILVDVEGHAHVTDFGLAKRVEAAMDLTVTGALLGTPAYMSPEQAAGRRGTITTATDVYGLGAILYSLLAGRAPYGGATAIETIDAVRNNPPEPPTKVNSKVPRDLETIALKCLEKDPRRRYASAQGLADDLHNWLESRPIAARRVGQAERAWLWCKRKPGVAALAASVAIAVVGGTAAVIAVQAKANTDLRAANRRVEQRYNLAVDAIGTFHTGVSEDFLLREPQFKELRDRLIRSASDFYEKLGALLERDADPASRRALLQANYELASLADKVGREEDALTLHRRVLAAREALAAAPGADRTLAVDVARSRLAVGMVLEAMSRTEEALESYHRAQTALAPAAGGPPAEAAARSAYADARYRTAWLLRKVGRPTEALHAAEEARDLQAVLAAADPKDRDRQAALARSHNLVGLQLKEAGQPSKALASLEAALAVRRKLARDHPEIAQYHVELANTQENAGWLMNFTRPADARTALEAARVIRQELAETHPAVARFQSDLAKSLQELGWDLLANRRKPSDALPQFEKALAIRKRLVQDHPEVADYESDLARSLKYLGLAQGVLGGHADEREAHQSARAVLQKLADAHPDVTQYQMELAECHSIISGLLRDERKTAEALVELRNELAIHRKLAFAHPDNVEFQKALASDYKYLGEFLCTEKGSPAQGLAECLTALAIREKLAATHPDDSAVQSGVPFSHAHLGSLYGHTGRTSSALVALREALAMQQKLVEGHPRVVKFRSSAAYYRCLLGDILWQTGDTPGALAAWRAAEQTYETLAKEESPDPDHRLEAASVTIRLGRLLAEAGEMSQAEAAYRQGLAVIQTIYDENPDPWYALDKIESGLGHLSDLLRHLGRTVEARAPPTGPLRCARKSSGPIPEIGRSKNSSPRAFADEHSRA
jgi:tetratricopeptide (TPR) repeat protein/predicted Ser/Thr protein kinase